MTFPRRSAPLILALALSASASLHCNMGRFVVRMSAPAFGKGLSVLTSYPDPEIARQAAPALLVMLEGLLISDPSNRILLGVLARGTFEYTFGFLLTDYERLRETDAVKAEVLRSRARSQFIRVYELGLRLLRTHGVSFTLQKTSYEEIQRKIAKLDKNAVPALTWIAVGAATALMLGLDQPWLMEMRRKIPLILKRVAALDPSYANGLPVGALGLYYARSATTGGSAITAQRYFKQAIELTKRRYLLWLVVYARNWAWQFQSVTHERVGYGAKATKVALKPADKKLLFKSLLDEVRRFPLASAPKNRLANTMAKRMARRLIARLEDFLSDQPGASPALARRQSK